LLARLDPELFAEERTRLAVRRERLRLPAASIERQHELTPERLPERILLQETADLRHQLRVPTKGQLGIDPVADHLMPHLVEASQVGLGEALVPNPLDGRPTPLAQCLFASRDRARVVACLQRAVPLGGGVLEALQVELAREDA